MDVLLIGTAGHGNTDTVGDKTVGEEAGLHREFCPQQPRSPYLQLLSREPCCLDDTDQGKWRAGGDFIEDDMWRSYNFV